MSSSSTDESDYAAVGSLQTVIPAGATVGPTSRACVTVSLVDDDLLELNGERFQAHLQSENTGVGGSRLINVSINDNDGNLTRLLCALCIDNSFHPVGDFQLTWDINGGEVFNEELEERLELVLLLSRIDGELVRLAYGVIVIADTFQSSAMCELIQKA